ncbi:tRNA pseudouridine(13) synthase TruD [Staphylothermus hellenicus]|uniref:tRNA pseudouridine(13) synthase TruD n=1 Tax=Staphylothermus hellenicus TaxID=84599 RepID=UPI00247883BE|nr:tRNA pseudouridine(13) synthase TruD [Staphylothermus hellenicus]
MYVHPLDYVSATKYYLTCAKLDTKYYPSTETFIVEEIIDWKKLGFSKENGDYAVFEIRKRNIDTLKAIRIIAKDLGIPEQNILFLGFKDRDSRSKQFFFIRKNIIYDHLVYEKVMHRDLEYEFIGYVRRKPRRKDLIGNKFVLIVKDVDKKDRDTTDHIMNMIVRHGLPSYYGYQRFGLKRFNSHLLGKYLLTGRIDLFIREFLEGIYPSESDESIYNRSFLRFEKLLYEKILVNAVDVFKAVNKINRMIRNILVDAYAAFLYNLLLNKIVEEKGWIGLDKVLPLPGCFEGADFYGDILRVEGFDHSVMKHLGCWYRKGLFRPINTGLVLVGDVLKISFLLESGMYASIIMRELFKDNLLFTRT